MKRLIKSIIKMMQSLIGEPSDDNTLLSYVPNSSPAPLEVTAPGTLTITIPPPVSAVYCNQFALGIPYGTGAGNLTDNPLDTSNISVNPSSKWQLSPGKASDHGFVGDTSAFVFSTISADSDLINYPIVITITIPEVNETPGPVQMLVKETSCTDGVNYTAKEGSININTAPYNEFYVNNFIATKSDSSGALIAEVEYNSSVILTWAGSDNQYFIIYDENPPQAVTGNSWPTPALTHTTTFILQASQQSSAAKGKSPKDPQTLYIYKTLTVIVRNPDVLGNTLSVSGNTVLSGTASVAGALQAASTLNVVGATTLADATVNGSLNVAGVSTSANANVNGNLNVAGSTNLQSTSIGTSSSPSNLTINGSNNISGNESIGGALTVSGAASVSSLSTNSIYIGAWSISLDGNGNLCFTNGSDTILFAAADGSVNTNSGRLIANNDPITVYSPTRNAYLNGTDHAGVDANGCVAMPYWMDANYPPDGDSNLRINFGNPF